MAAAQFSDFTIGRQEPVPACRMLVLEHRPSTFSQLIGQAPTVKTLRDMIGQNRLPAAILLSGVPGIGKTAIARLIAKALHCVGTDGNGGSTPDPCGTCDPCRAIAAGGYAEVLDLDCSRHGSEAVDAIEVARHAPKSDRPRVCFLDEVHLLKPDLLDAVTRALADPPENVKFIFATIAAHTLPAALLGLCQRFDLRPIPPVALAARLAAICRAEGKTPDPQMLAVVAAAANGSARQAIMILDGLLAIDQFKLQDWAHLRRGKRKPNKRKRLQTAKANPTTIACK